MKNFQKAIAIIALSGLCFAAPTPSDSEKGTKKAKHAKKEECADQLKDLKALVEQQQAALQQVQQELKQTQQQLQQTQQQLGMTTQEAKQAEAKAAEVDATNIQVQKVQADLSNVKTAVNASTMEAQKAEKEVGALEHPDFISYKHVRFTPGGYFDLSSVYRTHALNSGQATLFNSLPLGSALNGVGGLSEFSESARSTRLSLRADADAGSTKLTGYFEGDFYGLGVANPNQTSAWPFRIRQGWGRASWANGWKITGGQMWNLITMTRKAADADRVWTPNTIDTNYTAGWNWGRQAELRIAKTFSKDFTFALGLVDPSYLNLGATNTNGLVAGLASAGAGNLGDTLITTCTATPCAEIDTYSTNVAPDVILKLAYDSKFGHYEIKGIGRFFRDRVLATSTTPYRNNTDVSGGIGGGAIIPVLPKKVDFVAQGLFGKGISRYQDSGQYDFVVRTNTVATGTTSPATSTGGDYNLQPIKAFSAVVGFETHPSPKFEVDAYFGDEYYAKSTYVVYTIATPITKELEGYGASNAANNKNIAEGTVIAWYDLLKGSFGTLRYGAQYEYAERDLWTTKVGSLPGTYKGIDNVGMLSMKYILP
ncbi:MAG: hypothetical protein ABSD13_11575 [Candidatus Korobacteraceae bacterium]